MKSICGYWALDGAPVPDATLAAMRVAGLRTNAPELQAWRNAEGSLGFGSAWWSPQQGLSAPACIAMHRQSGCVAIADARLDNPAELRAALTLPAPDDAPDNTTDHAAQLILHAWLRWGEDCVERIDGDFAFAVHDPRQRMLFLARDRMGTCPLYIHHAPRRLLVFGSTSKAVLAHPDVPDDLNEARIADFLVPGMEAIDFTSTFHTRIQRLPPRHSLRLSPAGHELRQYWHLQPVAAPPRSDDEWAEALAAVMEDTVRRSLAGPYRVGGMLSGGLDSTSLAVIASDLGHAAGGGRFDSFSAIDSSRPDCPETAAVLMSTSAPGLRPTLVDISALGDLQPGIESLSETFDEPFDAHMTLVHAQYLVAARSGLSSVIDGIDGDTLFRSGNTIRRQLLSGHWAAAFSNARGLARYSGTPWSRLAPSVRSALIPGWMRGPITRFRGAQRLDRFLDTSLINAEFASSMNVEARWKKMLAQRSSAPLASPHEEAVEALQHAALAVAFERYRRVAAWHGISPIHPFANRTLIELSVGFSDRQRLNDGWTKAVLRHAMRGRLAEPVRLRHDKIHLSWFLTPRLWRQRREHLRETLLDGGNRLPPYVDARRIQAIAHDLDDDPQDFALRSSLAPYHLARWLQRRPIVSGREPDNPGEPASDVALTPA